jgi:hypothetical protein
MGKDKVVPSKDDEEEEEEKEMHRIGGANQWKGEKLIQNLIKYKTSR